ncbi:MAG: gamma carbonic anhydrase family protein [Gammaproteobacteria bacterium]|jgi:carbonic anhydrase/acetyltransferase-like protein (isoleucine patch superfamily)|nr:gamma carbonic anhydrase family protein [Gammaproteobacteria bacterium]
MIYDYDGRRLKADGAYFVAPSADVIGSVQLGHEASVWFGAVLRGDNDWIHIGAGTNVQDGSIIHVDPGVPVVVGANVTIGHGVMLHGCVIEDGCLIGNRAMVLDGARIGAGCLIGAGAVVTPNKVIPPGSVVMGSPGRIIREVEARDREWITRGNEAYRVKAREYARKLAQNTALPSSTTTA